MRSATSRSSPASLLSRQASSIEPARKKQRTEGSPHYRYIFYLDLLARADEPVAANALKHLQEPWLLALRSTTSSSSSFSSFPCSTSSPPPRPPLQLSGSCFSFSVSNSSFASFN